jgi:alpha-tubulin suppressor-like RCC1 family protein
MALKSDGTVWAWGANDDGELGDGTTDSSTVPVQASGLTNVVAIAAGLMRSIALKSDGTVWTCGYDELSEDGYIAVPTQVEGLASMVGIALADNHAVAVKSDGTVWAWGYNFDGQLGDGTTTDSTSPVQVNGLTNVVAVSANSNYTVALKSDGNLWAWGNPASLLTSDLYGGATNINKTLPTQVSGAGNIVGFSAGRANLVAVQSDGAVLDWGTYSSGQVGDGNCGRRSYPVQVRGFTDVTAMSATTGQAVARKSNGTVWTTGTNQIQGITSAISAAAGYMHYVAVMSDGTVRSWGSNSYGEYGNNTTTQSSSPVTALNVSGIIAVDAGKSHTLALKNDGTVLAWGYNDCGQLGDGTTTNRKTAVPVNGLTGVVAVSAGYGYSVALKSDGTVRKWGINGSIQIPGLAGITAISAGNNHLVALKSDGTVWTWGSNDSGQIGNGTFGGYASTAVQVSGLTGAVAVAAGGFHTVAVKSDGTVWAWGGNTYGQLGDGTLTGRATAAQVAGVSGCIAVCAGDYLTSVVKNNGTVWCWGNTGILGVDAPGTKRAAIRLVPSATDTDGDGMIDSWEMQYFGNLSHSGSGDSDGDGLTDMQEFSLGSNPMQANPDGDQFTDIADLYPNDYYNGVAPPTVAFNPPAGGTIVAAPAAITLSVDASAQGSGTITRVEFYEGATLLGTVTTPVTGTTSTYSFSPTANYQAGIYGFTAKAYDSNGQSTTSSVLTLTVLVSLPYNTDFETSEGYVIGSLSGQQGWTVNQGTAQVTAQDAFHGTQSVLLQPSTPPAQIEQVFAPLVGTDIIFVDFHSKPVAGSTASTSPSFEVESSLFAFALNNASGELQAFNGDGLGGGTWTPTGLTLAIGANNQLSNWARLTARLNFTHKTWDLYANGAMVLADLGFRDSTRSTLSSFFIQGDTTAPTLIDYFFAAPQNPLFADVNNNGIDDAWETTHGFSLATDNRDASPAGNGVTVIQAYVEPVPSSHSFCS